MKQLLALLDVLVAEVALEFEFLQAEDAGDEGVDVEDVNDDEEQEEDGENIVEGLPEDRDDVGVAHHTREGGLCVVDHLEEVVAERG